MFFIDFVYYCCAKFYKRYEGENSGYKISGQLLTAVLIGGWISLILLIFADNLLDNKWNTLYYMLPLILFVMYIYNRAKTFEEIQDQVLAMFDTQRIVMDILLIIFVTVAVPGFFGYAIYMGEMRNPPPFWEKWGW